MMCGTALLTAHDQVITDDRISENLWVCAITLRLRSLGLRLPDRYGGYLRLLKRSKDLWNRRKRSTSRSS